jgi:hypothetical protein
MADAAAENFTAVLSEDGTLYVLGGHPLWGVRRGLTPERMDGPRDAVALVAAGDLANHAHAGIVTVAGDLWMYSYGGSLGQSPRDVRLGPLAIPSGSGTPMDRALLGNDKLLMVTCGNDRGPGGFRGVGGGNGLLRSISHLGGDHRRRIVVEWPRGQRTARSQRIAWNLRAWAQRSLPRTRSQQLLRAHVILQR